MPRLNWRFMVLLLAWQALLFLLAATAGDWCRPARPPERKAAEAVGVVRGPDYARFGAVRPGAPDLACLGRWSG
jgi:hypothetical protein